MHLYGGKRTVKKGIVEVLSKDFPLTIKSLREKVAGDYGLSASYQAIHKEAWKLVRESILVSEEGLFALNSHWVKNCATFFQEIEREYCGKHQTPRIVMAKAQNRPLLLEFDRLRNLDEYVAEMIIKASHIQRDSPVIIFTHHRRFSILYPRLANTLFKRNNVVTFSSGNTSLDRFAFANERAFGATPKYQRRSENGEFIVIGDLVLQIYINEVVSTRLHRIFEGCNTVRELVVKELIDISETKITSTVLIQHNPDLALSLSNNHVKGAAKITLNDF